MRNNLKKILVVLTILLMLVYSFTPYVYAITNDLKEKNVQNEEELTDEVKKIDFSDFEIILSGILNKEKNKEIILSDLSDILDNKPTKNGVWIEPTSRDYLLDFINSLVNKIYTIDEDGYLVENKNISKNEIKEEYENNTKKVDKMISEDKLIVLEISDTYKNLNKIDNDIIDIRIEEDEYGLLFKDNDEEERNKENIIVLNSKIYSVGNNENDTNYLMTKFLETYYYNDESINDKNIENENTNSNNNNTTTIDDTNTYVNNNTTIANDNEISNEIITQNETEEQITKENIFDDRCSEKDFNLVLAGILSNDVNSENIDKVLQKKPLKSGIWISESSRDSFLKFINEHTIYTYSCNDNGYLICDNVMKNNPNLDILEKSETEVDKILKHIKKENLNIIIDISDKYLKYENDILKKQNLNNEEYVKTFSYDNERIILLKDNYYNNSGYDLALSDYMLKAFQNIQYKVLKGEIGFSKQNDSKNVVLRSDRSKTGYSSLSQNVYSGPDSSNYFKVGSVNNGEKLYILGQSAGWYHIQYIIDGQYNGDGANLEKSGYVPKGNVRDITGGTIIEEDLIGGQGYPKQGVDVQSCDDFDISTKIGSVYAGEGVSILYDYGYSDWTGKSYRVAYIEFSTSSGTKRGYVYKDQLNESSYTTSISRVITTSSAYSGPDGSFVKLGGAYYNEYVTVLAQQDNWTFVEYNTPSGRKRGYMLSANLENPYSGNKFFNYSGMRMATEKLTVYGGPNNNNANIGSVFNQEIVSYLGSERGYAYVEYNTANGGKRGYVLESSLIVSNPPSLPNLATYSNFSVQTYGRSGLGKDLKAYKIGNGSNVAFAVFAQHGWEDAWAYDGIELVKIADRMMNSLSSTGISNNWTLYIIPYANPDGIVDGYTNNGPGRCTVANKIDMNRCWPTNFRAYYTSRNYTGATPLATPEALALRAFIQNNKGNNDTILLDIHGWLNQTYGEASIGKYFDEQFGFTHSSTYGSGYLETWGKSIGMKSCLIELPMPSSAQDIINKDFSGKLTNGIRNMLSNNGEWSGEGTDVYEEVTVTSNGNLNVRSGPGTSFSIVTTVTGGNKVIRIKRNAGTANGYVWDKIRLSNGKEGYVATNYLALGAIYISGNSNDEIMTIKAYVRYKGVYNYVDTPTEYFDQDLIDALRRYQNANGLSETGAIDNATVIKMGFSLNTYGNGLEHNDFYNQYLTYAYNYINSEQPLNDVYTVDEKQFIKGVTYSEHDQGYETTKINGNQEWNSMSASEKAQKNDRMTSDWNRLKEAAQDYRVIYPLGAEALDYYLNGNGGEHNLGDIRTLFIIPSQAELEYTYLNRNIKAAEYFTTGQSSSFALKNEYDAKVEAGLDELLASQVGDFLSEVKVDWYIAAHSFKLGNYATVDKNGNSYSMYVNFNMSDYYDWDDSFIPFVLNSNITDPNSYIQESHIRDLHLSGKAKNFESKGIIRIKVEWEKGQTAEQGKVTLAN